MEKETASSSSHRSHVLVLPFHGQGHMNPMLQFSKRLASKHIKITVAATLSGTKSQSSSSISFESIYDDINDGGLEGVGGFKGFLERFEAVGGENLKKIIEKYQGTEQPIKCLVYDANLPWSLDVAKGAGILGAAFFTQSCATVADYLEMLNNEDAVLPELGFPTLPDIGPMTGRFHPVLKLILSHFSNLDKADWVLFNSFHCLEEKVIQDLLKLYPVRTIGPTLPSKYLDNRVLGDNDYGFSLYHSTGDTCVNWLNTKETGSVVYVSFGSAARLSAEQTIELAYGLKQSNINFLWVVRASEVEKLPVTFKENTWDRGLITTWCPQLEVLAHRAVGCFVTHCGWNSTVEGVSLGVPMVAMPQFLDQFSDAKFVEQIWGIGVRPKSDDGKGFVTRNEIERCIKEVMEGEKKEVFKRSASKWKELAKEAVDEGGSSETSISEIVARLVQN
ncbi:hypothetical protein ACHQM5_024157 [Ranunculus cassubicifolius]